jgi:integrase
MESRGGTAISGASRGLNRLTDRGVKSFIAKARTGAAGRRKLADGGGLYLTLTPAGTPVWRIKYRLGGRERLFAAGIYPDVTLESARLQRANVKEHLRAGRDPIKARLIDRQTAALATDDTFAAVAEVWLEKQRRDWSGIHYETSKRALARDVFPTLGGLPIDSMTTPMIAHVIEKIAERGAQDTAGRVLQHITAIYRFARSRGLVRDNVAADVRELLPRRRRKAGRPALVNLDDLRDVLRRANVAPVAPATRLANRLLAFSVQRVGNVVAAKWDQVAFNGSTAVWTIPRSEMKVKDREGDHRVPLGPTITMELLAWRDAIGDEGYVFPSPSGKRAHVGRETIIKLYVDVLGLQGRHSPHSWRTSFSTLAREVGEIDRDVIELLLDHVSDSQVIRTYNRAQRFAQRIRAAEWWDGELARTAL